MAGVRIDSPVPHLDRVFDYLVPEALVEEVAFGSRVRVRFAGRLVNGLVVSLGADSPHAGELRPIERVLGPEPVLIPEVLALAEGVAERMAGTVRDVLRAAIPPRHARAEAQRSQTTPRSPAHVAGSQAWERYRHGPALLRRLQQGNARGLRAAWSSAPGGHWPDEVAALVDAVHQPRQGGVILVVPDAWDVQRARAQLEHAGDQIAVLTADLGPERRYREFLRILRGQASIVIGTRAAVFAPVRDCKAIIVWQDGDEALWDPQAPYWNARDVAALRSHQTGCALLVGSAARSVAVQAWCEQGWARSVDPLRSVVRSEGPIVRGLEGSGPAEDAAASAARIPHLAWLVAKEGLRTGPVLVQVPRRGYLPVLACQGCRLPAQCGCGGPLALPSRTAVPRCRWCGALAAGWTCPSCHTNRLRAASVGVERTAEEFGRAFPGAAVIWSAADQQRRRIPGAAALVVATPGSEPVAEGGYAAVVILDARAQLLRTGLRATEDAVQRWFAAAMLARPRAQVVIAAEHGLPAVQAVLRWDAPWLASRELAERQSAGLPPGTRFAVLTGEHAQIQELAARLEVPHRTLGPLDERLIVVVDRSDGLVLARQLRSLLATKGAKGATGVRVMLDPRDV